MTLNELINKLKSIENTNNSWGDLNVVLQVGGDGAIHEGDFDHVRLQYGNIVLSSERGV